MRVETQATSLSWIPSEAVKGYTRPMFEAGISHYDEPPPGRVDDLEALRRADRFRFANVLNVWADFGDDGRVLAHGAGGGGVMGSTTVRLGPLGLTFAAVSLPDLLTETVGEGFVTVTRSAGGRTSLPFPRAAAGVPRWRSPLVWTTLSVTVRADGTSEVTLTGASPFPRHWVYDAEGALILKAGVTDFKSWAAQRATPWGAEDSPVVVTAAETALERELSRLIMRGARKPVVRELKEGAALVRQGEPGASLFLLLDGVVTVDVGGRELGRVGPGAVLGERALLENGRRTATLTALTPIRVAEAGADTIDRAALEHLAQGHRREEFA
ncbi:cyclic nucleotide-binding domain-containing protein [Herbidospora daliensis]|uniref:cyclic nucleotide-binding domain-containing protein n=1 Tax=Herbidospora daliensis TaxID=295585 RepID=UPI000780EA0F|nr:cyclic nucleotide-binding domain-containing protein [Herbidospora daliensis]